MREYADQHSEAAFSELVRRHVDLVYSAASRMVRDAQQAEDVAQATFVALASNARRLSSQPVLAGWLHITARNLAVKVVRSESRRRTREQEAATMSENSTTDSEAIWEEVAPHLDAALGDLNTVDRDALLLHYFQRKSARQMGQILGISEGAAQRRVSRAVERLRDCFARRGITVGAGGLAVVISAKAVEAAPAGLAAALSSAAVAAAPAGNGILTLVKIMATTKLKTSALGAVILAGAVSSVVIQSHSAARLKGLDAALGRQSAQLAQRKAENKRLSELVDLAASPSINNQSELGRLQSEIAGLRKQTNGLANLQAQASQLSASLADLRRDPAAVGAQSTVFSKQASSDLRFCMQLGLAVMTYASKHGDRFPPSLSQAAEYLPANFRAKLNSAPDGFQLMYTGTRTALFAKYAHPEELILIRQRQPWRNTDGKWVKVYGLADGSGRILSIADGNFDAWEQRHTIPSEAPGK